MQFSGVCSATQDLMFPFTTAKPYFTACSSDHLAFALSGTWFQTQAHILNHLCHKWLCEQKETSNVTEEREKGSETGKSHKGFVKASAPGGTTHLCLFFTVFGSFHSPGCLTCVSLCLRLSDVLPFSKNFHFLLPRYYCMSSVKT